MLALADLVHAYSGGDAMRTRGIKMQKGENVY